MAANNKAAIAPTPKEKRVGKAKSLTDRDMQLMRFIGQNGVASLEQVHNRYWTQAKERTAQERLQQLVNAGYLVRDETKARQPGGEVIYGITRKAANQFGKLEGHRLVTGLPSKAEMKQQLMAQDTRMLLEKELDKRGAVLIDWINERELRSEQRHKQIAEKGQAVGSRNRLDFEAIGDARIIIQRADENTHSQIEIEIDGAYYGKMLEKKLADMAATGQPTLWVTTGAGRASRIEREIQEAGITNIEVIQIG